MEMLKRLGLIEVGRTVLIKTPSMKRFQPFVVDKYHPGDRLVEGTLILKDKVTKLDSSLTAYEMNDKWIDENVENIERKIKLLTNVNIILNSFKKDKSDQGKINSTIYKD